MQLEKNKKSAFIKRFKFMFDLEGGDLFGRSFICKASDKNKAWQSLREVLPGAENHVKKLIILASN